MITGNKGEWSEFYTFLKILDERKLFFADADLNKIENKYYPVINIIREETTSTKKFYELDEKNKVKILNFDGTSLGVIDSSKIKLSVIRIFKKMKNSSGSFSIEEAEELITELKCMQIKAGNSDKADIIMTVKDQGSPMSVEMGFSVKSMLGGAATLLNASGSTNFVYRIEGFRGNIEEINGIDSRAKVRDRIKAIEEGGGKIIFDSLSSERFKNNLKKIDVAFTEILAAALKNFYEGKGATIAETCSFLSQNEELAEKYDLSEDDFKFKIKVFLRAVALGMVPNKDWNGLNAAHGGYLIVKEDGDVVCYHLYNMDAFQDYLFKNTKFDTPSTSRHGFGTIYKKDEKLFINLNLQIRFLK
jgi:type II restriction enzyme